jgi:hypothetical protein
MKENGMVGRSAARSVIVYGGAETGCETAEFLAARGIDVKLVTRSSRQELARAAEPMYRRQLRARDLVALLRREGIPCAAIGDARAIGRIGDAVHGAHAAIRALDAKFR